MTTNERTDLGLTDSAARLLLFHRIRHGHARCRIGDHTGCAGGRDDLLALRDERH